MDVGFLNEWGTLILSGIAILGWVFHSVTARSKDNSHIIEAMQARLMRVENELKHIPSKDEMHQMQIRTSEIQGVIKVIDERTQSLGRTVKRIEDYLLKKGEAS